MNWDDVAGEWAGQADVSPVPVPSGPTPFTWPDVVPSFPRRAGQAQGSPAATATPFAPVVPPVAPIAPAAPAPHPRPQPRPQPAALLAEGPDESTVARPMPRELATGSTIALTVQGGETVTLEDAVLVIGRNPVCAAGENGLRVNSPLVSKTHVAIGIRDGDVWMQDRESTNGTTITDEAGRTADLRPGRRTMVPLPIMFQFGDQFARIERR